MNAEQIKCVANNNNANWFLLDSKNTEFMEFLEREDLQKSVTTKIIEKASEGNFKQNADRIKSSIAIN